MLERVELECSVDGNRLYFPCKQLFDRDEDNGKIEQELLPVDEGILARLHILYSINGSQLAKLKKRIPLMLLP